MDERRQPPPPRPRARKETAHDHHDHHPRRHHDDRGADPTLPVIRMTREFARHARAAVPGAHRRRAVRAWIGPGRQHDARSTTGTRAPAAAGATTSGRSRTARSTRFRGCFHDRPRGPHRPDLHLRGHARRASALETLHVRGPRQRPHACSARDVALRQLRGSRRHGSPRHGGRRQRRLRQARPTWWPPARSEHLAAAAGSAEAPLPATYPPCRWRNPNAQRSSPSSWRWPR